MFRSHPASSRSSDRSSATGSTGPGIQRGVERSRRARVFHDGTDGSQLRDRHRPPPLATAESVARDRAAPLAVDCPVQPDSLLWVEGADSQRVHDMGRDADRAVFLRAAGRAQPPWADTRGGENQDRARCLRGRRRDPVTMVSARGRPDGRGARPPNAAAAISAVRRPGTASVFQWPARCGGGSLGGSRSRCRGSKSWTRCAMRSGR